jgi:lysozyme family protein
MIAGFADAFRLTCGIEGDGKLSTDPNDPGNYTGGKVGGGKLVGTRFGISAAAFPNVDIATITYGQAQALAKQRYWDPYSCDQLNPVVGWMIFDAAYNGGHPAQWLQAAIGATVDGVIGAQTIAAVRNKPLASVVLRFMASREDYWTTCGAWRDEGAGWIHRGTEMMRTISDCL